MATLAMWGTAALMLAVAGTAVTAFTLDRRRSAPGIGAGTA